MEEFLGKIAPKEVQCAYLETKRELVRKYAATGKYLTVRYFSNLRYLLIFAIIESFKRIFTDVEAQRLDSLREYTLKMAQVVDKIPGSVYLHTFDDYEMSQRVERLSLVWKDSHPGRSITRMVAGYPIYLVDGKEGDRIIKSSQEYAVRFTKRIKYRGLEEEIRFNSDEEGVGDFLNLFIDSDWGGFLVDLYENPEKLKSWSDVAETPLEDYIFDEDYVAQLYLNFLEKPKADREYREKWIPKGKTPADRVLKFLGIKKDLGGKQRFEAFKARMFEWRKSGDVQKLREFILETEDV